MSLPPDAKEQKVSLKASVPYDLMPSGNSFFVCFTMRSLIFGCIKPSVLFLIKSSKFMPSMISRGSRVFPLDFDIF